MLPTSAITFSQPSAWVREHLREDFSMTAFRAGEGVLDVGCGFGRNLEVLIAKGVKAEGVDPDPEGVGFCEQQGLPVRLAPAEKLPFEAGSFDGVVLDGVLQFTNPVQALAEAARVLRAEGTLLLATQGAGYALHLARVRRGKAKLYGLRAMVNGWLYAATGGRLPGWMGDTLCFTQGKLKRLCTEAGLEVVEATEGARHLGLPVFLYLRAQRKL